MCPSSLQVSSADGKYSGWIFLPVWETVPESRVRRALTTGGAVRFLREGQLEHFNGVRDEKVLFPGRRFLEEHCDRFKRSGKNLIHLREALAFFRVKPNRSNHIPPVSFHYFNNFPYYRFIFFFVVIEFQLHNAAFVFYPYNKSF